MALRIKRPGGRPAKVKRPFGGFVSSLSYPIRPTPYSGPIDPDSPGRAGGPMSGPAVGGSSTGGGSTGSGNYPTDGPSFPSVPGMQDFGSLLSALAGRRAAAEGQARAGIAQMIANIRKAYADTLPALKNNYGTAIQESQAVNDAVANRLAAQGAGANQQLAAKLAQIGANPTGELTQQTLDYYKGLGGANYAMDEGDVQRLVGRLSEEQAAIPKMQIQAEQQAQAQLAQMLMDIADKYDQQQMDLQGQQSDAQSAHDQAVYEDQWRRMQWLQDQQDKAEAARQQELDRIAAQREAAMATANANRQKQLDRQFKAQQAKAQRDYELALAKAKYEASAKSQEDKQAFDAEQARIDREFKASQNALDRNAKGGKGGKSGSGGSSGDTVDTPGSAKRARAYKAAWNAIVRPDGQVRYTARYGDQAVNNAINAALRANGVNPNSPAGRQIRSGIKQQIRGRRVFRPPNKPVRGPHGVPVQNYKTPSQKPKKKKVKPKKKK